MSALNSGLPNQPDKVVPPPTPASVTTLTSGSGNFVPGATTRWLRVTLTGGGSAGNSTSGTTSCTSGLAAKPVTYWVKKTKGIYAYAIGAGGAGVAAGPGGAGGNTTFDTLTAYGAPGGVTNPMVGTSNGEHSPYGAGGAPWYGGGGLPGSNATGFGAGGGGTQNGAAGGNGSGGLIIIEEY